MDPGDSTVFRISAMCLHVSAELAQSIAASDLTLPCQQQLIFVFKVGKGPHINNVGLGRHGLGGTARMSGTMSARTACAGAEKQVRRASDGEAGGHDRGCDAGTAPIAVA